MRTSGPLNLPVRYRTQLYHLNRHLRGGAAPALALGAVVEVEAALGVVLPDRLLALAASAGLDPRDWVGATRDQRARWGLEKNVVTFGLETWDLGGYRMPLCTVCEGPGSDLVFAWDWKSEVASGYRSGAPHEGTTFEELLTWRWGRWQSLEDSRRPVDLETPELDLDAPVEPAALEAFVPRIVVPPARRVVHPKFGEGVVQKESGDTLEIEFPNVGVKRIAARFVTPVR